MNGSQLIKGDVQYGLNFALRRPEGQSILWYLKSLPCKLKYAWQRAWRGWDDSEVFELRGNFTTRMIGILRQFKEVNIATWYDREQQRFRSEEETNSIIDEIILHFEESDEDKWITMGISASDSDRIEQIYNDAAEHQKKAFELFSKHFDDLWI